MIRDRDRSQRYLSAVVFHYSPSVEEEGLVFWRHWWHWRVVFHYSPPVEEEGSG